VFEALLYPAALGTLGIKQQTGKCHSRRRRTLLTQQPPNKTVVLSGGVQAAGPWTYRPFEWES